MKPIKRAFPVILAACLTAFAALPVFAQLSIVDSQRTGSITIHKLAVDHLQDYDTPATGEEVDVEGFQPLANIGFTVTRVEDTAELPTEAPPLKGEGSYSQTIQTDENGRAVFADLAQGVYLVHEEESASVEAPVADFLVSIPMTNAAGNGWIYDVVVYPKNQLIGQPQVDMFIHSIPNKSAPADLGGPILWIVTSDIPGDIAKSELYQIRSTPGEHLKYEAGSVEVYTEDRNTARIPLTAGEDYTLTTGAGDIVVDLSPNGKTKLATALDNGFTPKMYTSYQTAVNIPVGSLGGLLASPISNTAELRYTNAIGINYTDTLPDSSLPYVFTGGIRIKKIDDKSGASLSGASFKLYRTMEDAVAGTNALQDSGEDWEATTDNDGFTSFLGLAYGEPGVSNDRGETTYYLVETRAPAGYNLLRSPVAVKVNDASHLEGNELLVRDNTGFSLPATGGMGTMLFTVVGLALVGTAVYLFFRNRNR